MVAKITSPQSINRALNYNEQKVQQGKAESLFAGNFLKEIHELNFYEKLHRFEHQNVLNDRTKRSTLHISLNFDSADNMHKEKLAEIAQKYMEKIGFGKQPYLVYQHHDAGHAHIHIVTTSIQADGKRINTYNIGRNQSESARKDLEKEYNLVPAESKKQDQNLHEKWSEDLLHRSASAQKVQYGKMETKRAITNVLDVVINQFKYTSLPELNAVLKLYSVMAVRGDENSRLYKLGGLHYRVLDVNGNKIGAPIKASAFHMKPTLKYLEKKFQENEGLKQQHMRRAKIAIDLTLKGKNITLSAFEKALHKDGIQVVVRRNEESVIYGMTYVDFKTKCVFNGSDLGKEYSAKGLIERLARTITADHIQSQKIVNSNDRFRKDPTERAAELAREHNENVLQKGIEIVLQPVEQQTYVPGRLLKKKKKRIGLNRSL